MDTVMNVIAESGLVPVVVLDKVEDAVPTAKALLAGGVNVMEITFRTAAAAESIKAVVENCPNMLVGAGTIIDFEQCKKAVEYGAKFIVSPGYDEETVAWCVKRSISIIPGCVTPTEIMMAQKHGLRVVKFFPASIYGGLSAMKALSGPFPGIQFIPTGGVNSQNIGEFVAAPFVYAVGGSWVCTKKDIAEGAFDRITNLCKEAKKAALGFEVAHIGINSPTSDSSMDVCRMLNDAFGFGIKEGNSSNFVSSAIEVMKSNYYGEKGHIAIRTNNIVMAIAELKKAGFDVNEESRKVKADKLSAIYLNKEFGGFAIHLLQR